jgi:hypothetical protein
MAELSSKDLVKGLFGGKEMARPPFIPWVCSFAARLEQVPVQDMLSDPGVLSRACLNAQELLGYDAITAVFDPALEAEACGCEVEWTDDGSLPRVTGHPFADGASLRGLDANGFDKKGRIPVVLEATKRLKQVRGKQVAIAAVVTGPLTLAAHLSGETFFDGDGHSDGHGDGHGSRGGDEARQTVAAAADIILRLCKRYCEAGVDLIAVAEEGFAGVTEEGRQHLAGVLKSFWNVLKFYGVNSLILSRGCGTADIEPLISLKADGLAIAGDFDAGALRDMAVKANVRFSRSVPSSVLCGEGVTDAVKNLADGIGRSSFLSTEWDVPYDASVAAMQEIADAVGFRR